MYQIATTNVQIIIDKISVDVSLSASATGISTLLGAPSLEPTPAEIGSVVVESGNQGKTKLRVGRE